MKGSHRLGIVVDCHGILKKYSPLVFVVIFEDRVRKGKRKSLLYSQIIFKAFRYFFDLLIFKIQLFTEILRPSKVSPNWLFFSFKQVLTLFLISTQENPQNVKGVRTWSQSLGPRMYSRVLSCFCIFCIEEVTFVALITTRMAWTGSDLITSIIALKVSVSLKPLVAPGCKAPGV